MGSIPIFPKLFAIFMVLICPSECYNSIEDRFNRYNKLELHNATGPESLAFDCNGGGPYTGVSDGRVLKWQGDRLGWTEFAVTSPIRQKEVCDNSTDPDKEHMCGRPLGLQFNMVTCDLYIADAYFGLLKVSPKGGLATQLATTVEGVPFRFTNNLDIDTTSDVVYFTDTSTVYQRREYILSIITGDKSGRLLKYDIKTKKVTVLLKGLAFANGVALSKDKTFLLVAQTGTSTILQYLLKGPKARTSKVFAQLNGFPDNIEITKGGHFWVALSDGEGSFGNFANPDNLDNVKKPLLKTPDVVADVVTAAVKFDRNGKVVEVLNVKQGKTLLRSVTDVREHDDGLWIGSLVMPSVGLFTPS